MRAMALRPNANSRPGLTCLALVPYDSDLVDIRRIVARAASESGIDFSFAEDSLPLGVRETIFPQIERADLILAVPTLGSANIFYETGLAHAIGKPVIFLIDEDGPSPPFVARSQQVVKYARSIAGLKRLDITLRKLFADFRQNPRRFRSTSTIASRSTLPVIDFDRLPPRDFENLCFELLNRMGFRRVQWGKEIEHVDAIATLPKKDPDGHQYEELWLISMGLRAPPEILLEIATQDPGFLLRRLHRAGAIEKNRNSPEFDTPITFLIMLVRDDRPADFLQQEIKRLEKRFSDRSSNSVRIRIWDRQQLVSLIQQYPQIAIKYFSDEGRPRSDSRKSYEDLYKENIALTEKYQSTITDLEQERDRRARAERDAVWKDVAFTAAHKLGNPIFALETNLQGLRVEARSKRGQILISASTQTRIKSNFQVEDAGSINDIKNIPGEYKIFSVLGSK